VGFDGQENGQRARLLPANDRVGGKLVGGPTTNDRVPGGQAGSWDACEWWSWGKPAGGQPVNGSDGQGYGDSASGFRGGNGKFGEFFLPWALIYWVHFTPTVRTLGWRCSSTSPPVSTSTENKQMEEDTLPDV